ncbi:PF20097 family protein [Acholeplasma granularum]|uniref:PF20097 family protein n=1 Tax=Acholeplasma granularum TaxID=264635 RepID=UPI0004704D10|nr:PF20097 family protein [Acholeplasma granularum]
MENNKCPYCGNNLIEGKIYGERYRLKWMPKEDKLALGIWVKPDHIPLGYGGFYGVRPRVNSSYCQNCQKMIIDLKNQK